MIDRPLSPHLQIYKLPLAAIISISHRVMGGVLFVSAIVISLLCLAWFAHIDFNWITSLIFSWLVIFYALAEIRYIVWGLNHGISPTFVSTSNMLIVAATFVISAMCWVKMWGGL